MREGGLARIRDLPFPLFVLAAAFPRRLPTLVAVGLGLGLYNLEKRMYPSRVHPLLARKLGFSARVYDARDCETPEELASLVLASSATPPFTPVGNYRGERLLDGGMIDNVPASVAETVRGVDRNLVVVTRPYPPGTLGRHGRRLYVGPSHATPISRWDYTRPDLLEETIRMGQRESTALYGDWLRSFLDDG
jgi:hypothetical protein